VANGKVATVALFGAALNAVIFAQGTVTGNALVFPAAQSSAARIHHLIIIMQENRSFDSYFGTFPGADGIPMKNGEPVVCVPDPARSVCIKPYHNPFDVNGGGPHGASNATADVDQGKMDGFLAQSEQGTRCENPLDASCAGAIDVMGYHDGSDIANYWAYAKNFVLQDRMFEPNASWSLPEHLFMLSEWSAYCTEHNNPSSCLNALQNPGFPPDFQPPRPNPIYAWTDLTYLLHRNGVSWGYYIVEGAEPDCENDEDEVCPPIAQNAKTPGIWNPLPYFDTVKNDGELGNIQPISKFLSQASAGTLPAVSWVVPSADVSEHPPGAVTAGQSYVTALINAVMSGPNWNDCAIFLAWDDWGGFYDHVTPVTVDENGYGLRVPGLVISPYAKRGYIDHQTLSFDAYVKFIEDIFLSKQRLDPVTDGRPDPRPDVRENAAALGDLSADFDFTQSPRPPMILPVHPATALLPKVPSGKIAMSIDVPQAQSGPFLGAATFVGWAMDNAGPITNVQVSVDGVPVGSADYGEVRQDICTAHSNQVGCPNVGWSWTTDTTTLASGEHDLEVTAISATGQQATANSSFTVANWMPAAADPMRISIDRPNSASAAFSGAAAFGGWAIDDIASITQVSLAIDGISSGNAFYGAARPDVCNVYSGRAGCPNVGWNLLLDTTTLADGSHTLAVTATSAGGAHSTTTAPFTVSNLSPQNPIVLSIDNPGSQSPAVSGRVAFGGWAIDRDGAVAGVNVLLDGMPVGNAVYGGVRPDVCAAFPAVTGCPDVGWNFALDTTLLPNGEHTFGITATASDGRHATAVHSFNVSNSPLGDPTRISIDQPSARASTLVGVATLSGWAVNDNAPISSVAVAIDGAPYGNAAYGGTRPDVCSVYPGRPGCPNVGWAFGIDTTQLADGAHTLSADAIASNGQHLAISTPFGVANWSTANPMRIGIDNPNAQSAPFSGVAVWGGWALDDQSAITNVTVSIDGVSFGNAAYGGGRPDVCNVYPGRAGCPNVGWNISLDTTSLADGPHTLDLTATSAGGQHTTAEASFKVANLTGANPMRISIDRPNSQTGALSGIAAVGGWAIDMSAAISTISVEVDRVQVGTAKYGGDRPDVCALYAGAIGCPNVGWNFLLNTSSLSNGMHTLDVKVSAADGQQGSESSTFTVAN
jgi:phospholipase C